MDYQPGLEEGLHEPGSQAFSQEVAASGGHLWVLARRDLPAVWGDAASLALGERGQP